LWPEGSAEPACPAMPLAERAPVAAPSGYLPPSTWLGWWQPYPPPGPSAPAPTGWAARPPTSRTRCSTTTWSPP
jgi:hypothetical protein